MGDEIVISIFFENGNHLPYTISYPNSLLKEEKLAFIELFIENCCLHNKISVRNVEKLDSRLSKINDKSKYLKTKEIYLRTNSKILFPEFVNTKEDPKDIIKKINKSTWKSFSFFKNLFVFRWFKSKPYVQETVFNTDISLDNVDKSQNPLLEFQNFDSQPKKSPEKSPINLKNKKNKSKSKINGNRENHYLFKTGEIYINEVPDGKGSLIFSFLPPETPYNEKFPPPEYLSRDQVDHTKGRTKEDCFKGWKVLPSGDLKCVDQEVLKSQKGLIPEVVKMLAQCMAEGRGMVGVSLPVRIFEPRSLIERIVDWWSYLPIYAKKSVESDDPVFRFKCSTAFYMAGLHVGISLYKPFNPIMGETYQGFFPDGTSIDVEHTSHHPPVSNFYLVGPGYKFYGSYEYKAKTSSSYNEITMYQCGPTYIEFDNGQKIQLRLPSVILHGMMWGEKTIRVNGVFYALDEKNGMKGIMGVGYTKKNGKYVKSKTSDEIAGALYYYDKDAVEKQNKNIKNIYKEEMKMSDIKESICDASGSWLHTLKFDDETFWDIEKDRPLKHTAHPNPLPSDCRFREDLIYLKRNDKPRAQYWKSEIERRQRHERGLREKEAKKRKK